MTHPEKTIDNSFPLKYTFQKFIRFFPYTTMGTVLYCILMILQHSLTVAQSWKMILFLPIQLLLLPLSGIMSTNVQISDTFFLLYTYDAPLWYLSALLMALPIMMYLVIIGKRLFSWIVIFLPLLLYGFLMNSFGTIAAIGTLNAAAVPITDKWICGGVVRALAGLLLGCLTYKASLFLARYKFTALSRYLLTILEIGLYTLVSVLSCMSIIESCSPLIALIFVVALTITFSKQSLTSRIHFPLFTYTGKVCLALYCLHWPIMMFIEWMFGYHSYEWKLAISLAIIIPVSFVAQFIISHSESFFQRAWIRIRPLFFLNDDK